MLNILKVFADAYGTGVVYFVLGLTLFLVVLALTRRYRWKSGPLVLYSYSFFVIGAIVAFMTEGTNTTQVGSALGSVILAYALCYVYSIGVIVIGICYLARKKVYSTADTYAPSGAVQFNTQQTLRPKSRSAFGLYTAVIGVVMTVSAPFVTPYILFLPQIIEAYSESNNVTEKNTPILNNKTTLDTLEKLAEEKTYKLSFRPHLPTYYAGENDLTLVAHENDTIDVTTEMAILGEKVTLYQFDAQKLYQKTDVMQICNEDVSFKKPCKNISSIEDRRVLKLIPASYSLTQQYAYEVDGIFFLLTIDNEQSNIDSEAIKIFKSLKPLVNWRQH